MADTKIAIPNFESERKLDESADEIPENGGGICKGIIDFGRGARCYFVFGVLAAMLNGCAFPSFSILFQGITDALFSQESNLKEQALDIMIQFIILGAATFVCSIVQHGCLGVFGTHLGVKIREVYFDKLLRQEISYYDKKNSGKVNTIFIQNTNNISTAMGTKIGFFLQNITQFLAGFAVAFYFSWLMALILLACIPVLAIVGFIQAKIMLGGNKDKSDPFTLSGQFTNEALLNIKTVIANPKLLTFKVSKYSNILEKAYPLARKRSLITGFGLGGMQFGMFGVMYSIGLYFGSGLVDRNVITIGEMMGCLFGFLIGGTSLGSLGSVMEDIAKAKKALNELYYLLQREINIKNVELTSDFQEIEYIKKDKLKGDIMFDKVGFSYPSVPDIKVLNNININIKSGSNIAIVGPSGSGKSTIINLLERFYDNTEGNIIIDGKNINEYDLNYLRTNIGFVSQLPLLFKESVKENIRGGNKNITDNDIIEASKFAQCHDFIINNLPNGYDTLCGEMGDRLSGGQKQRISIARAIVTKPIILLFDEATSALDTNSEKEVQKAIHNITASHNHTIITIAHRLSTIKNADMIIVLVDGNIKETGNHDSLMQDHDGIYYKLVRSQELIDRTK